MIGFLGVGGQKFWTDCTRSRGRGRGGGGPRQPRKPNTGEYNRLLLVSCKLGEEVSYQLIKPSTNSEGGWFQHNAIHKAIKSFRRFRNFVDGATAKVQPGRYTSASAALSVKFTKELKDQDGVAIMTKMNKEEAQEEEAQEEAQKEEAQENAQEKAQQQEQQQQDAAARVGSTPAALNIEATKSLLTSPDKTMAEVFPTLLTFFSAQPEISDQLFSNAPQQSEGKTNLQNTILFHLINGAAAETTKYVDLKVALLDDGQAKHDIAWVNTAKKQVQKICTLLGATAAEEKKNVVGYVSRFVENIAMCAYQRTCAVMKVTKKDAPHVVPYAYIQQTNNNLRRQAINAYLDAEMEKKQVDVTIVGKVVKYRQSRLSKCINSSTDEKVKATREYIAKTKSRAADVSKQFFAVLKARVNGLNNNQSDPYCVAGCLILKKMVEEGELNTLTGVSTLSWEQLTAKSGRSQVDAQ